MAQFDLWLILGTAVFLFYNIYVLNFASKILEQCRQNIFLHLLLAVTNLVFIFIIFYFQMPRYFVYGSFYLLLCLEFKLISKSKWVQAWFGASSFMLNIAPIHLLSVLLLSVVQNIPSTQFFIEFHLIMQSVTVTFGILSATLLLFRRLIKLPDLLVISKNKIYASVVSFCALLIVINTSFDNRMFITPIVHPEMLVMSIANILLYYIVFYCIFAFALSLSKMHQFKRKSDEVDISYHELIRKKSNITKQIYTDDLTGAYNRKYAYEKLDLLLSDNECSFTIFFMDIAALKYVNDSFGHEVGDRYLMRVTTALQQAIRDTDTVARIGGDEFLVLAENTERADVARILHRIKQFVNEQNQQENFLVHVNIGSVFVGNTDQKPEKSTLLDEVDQRMREDKKNFYKAMESSS